MHHLTQMFKTGHFTLDNAANNKTMMKELKKLLADREIAFHADDNRIMCFPHVVNIATQRVHQENDTLLEWLELAPLAILAESSSLAHELGLC